MLKGLFIYIGYPYIPRNYLNVEKLEVDFIPVPENPLQFKYFKNPYYQNKDQEEHPTHLHLMELEESIRYLSENVMEKEELYDICKQMFSDICYHHMIPQLVRYSKEKIKPYMWVLFYINICRNSWRYLDLFQDIECLFSTKYGVDHPDIHPILYLRRLVELESEGKSNSNLIL